MDPHRTSRDGLLVVVVPAYNESKTIGEVVGSVPRDCMGSVKVVVVDDGSTDKTSELAKSAGADRVERLSKNRGLGVAFRIGIETALTMGADYIVNIDADMQFDPKDIPKLIGPIVDGEVDFVTCSRFLERSFEPKMPLLKKVGNKIFSRLISVITGVNLADTQCGFRAYSREAALRLNVLSPYTYTQESLIDLIEKGMRVKEVPCRVKGERDGKSRIVDNVFSYTLRSLTIIIRTVRDYRPLVFFGGIGAVFLAGGTITGSFMILHYLIFRRTSPYASLISGSALFFIIGFILIVMALQADMQTRQRKMLDELMYHQRNRLAD